MMDFRLLGPVAAYDRTGQHVPLGGPKQRAILALLLVNAGRVVETDHIVDELYLDESAEGGRKTVQAYVSRLRTKFTEYGEPNLVHSRPSGYILNVDADAIDAGRFERALTDARAVSRHDPAEAARALVEALKLWRGRPFEDAHPTPELQLEATRLDEHRLAAIEAWAEATLAAGGHREALGDLRRFADAFPVQEHLWALLMLALYRSGRQGEALGLYVELARRLSEELGVEPSSELAQLQLQMLQQDPTLELHPSAPVVQVESSPEPRARRLRPALPTVAVAVAVVAVVAVAVLGGLALFLPPTAVNRASPRLGQRVAVPRGSTQIAAAGGRVWVMDGTRAEVMAVSPNGRAAEYVVPAIPSAIAGGMGYVWIASEEEGLIAKLDAASGRVVGTAEGLDLTGASIAVGTDAVWVVREHVEAFLRVDPDTLEVATVWFRDGLPGGPEQPSLAVAGLELWGVNAHIGRVLVFDPERPGSDEYAGDARVAEHAARSILADRDVVWFSQPTNGSVTRVDTRTRQVTAIVEVGQSSSAADRLTVAPYGLSTGPGGVWVALPDDGEVVLLEADSGTVVADLGFQRPTSIAASTGYVWVLDAEASELVQILPESCTELPFIGPGADLRGCDLSGKVFVGLDLTGADLRWAKLRLVAAQRADLTDADLFGADLSGAALDGAIWHRTRCPDGTLSTQHGETCVPRPS